MVCYLQRTGTGQDEQRGSGLLLVATSRTIAASLLGSQARKVCVAMAINGAGLKADLLK